MITSMFRILFNVKCLINLHLVTIIISTFADNMTDIFVQSL